MDYRQLSRLLGLLLLLVATAMVLCLAYALFDRAPGPGAVRALGLSALVTAAFGGWLFWLGRASSREILRREAVAVVVVGWTLSAVFGALPYVLCQPGLPPAAAFFESVSGFTTTGSTVMDDIEAFPRGILLWRATTQWLGGMGILVLFVAVLSMAGGASKSLFRHESTAQFGEGFAARMRDTALRLWQIYLALTAVCLAGLLALGMPAFDAVCHAFTTVATGGFSTRNASIAAFNSPAIEWWMMIFMVLGAISFMLYAWLLARRWSRWQRDEETRFYLWTLVIVTVAVTGSLLYYHQIGAFGDTFRTAAFQVISIGTTTGFTTTDYDRWANFPKILLVALMFMGGCAGSTAGGVKVSRIVVFFKNFARQLTHTFRPNRVMSVRFNGVNLSEGFLNDVSFYVALVAFIVALGSLAMSILEPGFDLVTCFGATVATIFNIGPGIGGVGPSCTFAHLGPATQILLSLFMIMGRLEILAVLACFVPQFWRKY